MQHLARAHAEHVQLLVRTGGRRALARPNFIVEHACHNTGMGHNARRHSLEDRPFLSWIVRTDRAPESAYFAISIPCSRISPSGTCWKPVMLFFIPTIFFAVHRYTSGRSFRSCSQTLA